MTRQSTPTRQGSQGSFEIDCRACAMQATAACKDCVVTYILDRPQGAVIFDVSEERAIRAMARAGLLPDVRWQAKEADTG